MPTLSPAIRPYFDALSELRSKRLRELHDRIVSRFPRAVVSLRYRMPTFENGDAWMAIASQKSYVSVYTCARPHIEPYLKLHPKTKSGTGCLNFPDGAEIDMKALDTVIDHALGSSARPRPKKKSAGSRPAQKTSGRKSRKPKKR